MISTLLISVLVGGGSARRGIFTRGNEEGTRDVVEGDIEKDEKRGVVATI